MKISIAQLSLDPKNARKHSARNLEAIAASLLKFGQRKPLVVHRGVAGQRLMLPRFPMTGIWIRLKPTRLLITERLN